MRCYCHCCGLGNSPCLESLFFILEQKPILAWLSGQTARVQNLEEQPVFYGLINIFNLLPVFTDVDLLLLDQTSYFSRCLCSGFFYA